MAFNVGEIVLFYVLSQEVGFLATVFVSPRVPLVEVLMITNQSYWLLMVKVELS